MDHDRYTALIVSFWRGDELTEAKLEDLNRLHLLRVEQVGRIVTGTKEIGV